MSKINLACKNLKIPATNHSFLLGIARYASSDFMVFVRNFEVFPRH